MIKALLQNIKKSHTLKYMGKLKCLKYGLNWKQRAGLLSIRAKAETLGGICNKKKINLGKNEHPNIYGIYSTIQLRMCAVMQNYGSTPNRDHTCSTNIYIYTHAYIHTYARCADLRVSTFVLLILLLLLL